MRKFLEHPAGRRGNTCQVANQRRWWNESRDDAKYSGVSEKFLEREQCAPENVEEEANAETTHNIS